MKFRKVITGIGTIRKQDFYDFSLTKEQIIEARKRTFENPLLIYKEGSILSIYNDKGELRLNYFVSYYGFLEGLGKHEPKEFSNMVICSCGKRFPQGKGKNGMKNFKKHLSEIENIRKQMEEKKNETK